MVGVADGDTLTVLDGSHQQTEIRLHQIDAPEKKQDFGQRSKQSLSALVYGQQVRMEVADTDKCGRTVGKVWINGTDANLEQVKRGMDWVYEKYVNERAYFDAERTAKMNRTGLPLGQSHSEGTAVFHGEKSNGGRYRFVQEQFSECQRRTWHWRCVVESSNRPEWRSV